MAARATRTSDEGRPRRTDPQPAAAEERQEQHVTRSPDYKAQYGRVQAAVWKRDIDGRPSYSVTVTRSYKDKQDQWQRTNSLDEDDLLPAAKALDDAYTWIQRQRHQARDSSMSDLRVPPRAANS